MTRQATRYHVFGLPIDALTMDETVERCRELIECRRPVQHVVLNVIKVVLCSRDDALRRLIASCPLVNADGTYFTWAARSLGAPLPERVTGIDLMERLLDLAAQEAWPAYFLGAKQDVLDAFTSEARRRFPRLAIAGTHHGYFRGAEEDRAVAAGVRASGARLLFVALPSPRKEMFVAEQLEELGEVFAMGVGGSFDVWAGLAKRAPVWMQRAGLEWLFRLVQEPRRMWKRIVVNGWTFTLLFVRELVRRTPPLEEA